MKSGLRTPEQLLMFMEDFDYRDYDTLMTPLDVYKYGEGSCHDQTLFEYTMITQMGLNPEAKFIMAVDKDNVGGETHSFVYWIDDNGSAYWFENAWEDYRGIHKFDNEEDLLDAVISYFTDRNPNQYIFMAKFDPSEHIAGEDLDTFVDICMENAVQV